MITFVIQDERPAVDPLVTSGHWVKVHTPQPVAQLGEVVASQCETDYSEALKNLPVSALVTSRLQQSPVLCMENVRKTFISKVLHHC